MILSLKSLSGILYIQALLEKINQIKNRFLFEIEDGIEAFIPKELSMDHLPLSFWYYDPILSIVAENISTEKR